MADEQGRGRPRPGPPRHRPPWWPENEAWPPTGRGGRPTHWGRGHGPWRMFGCLFAVIALFTLLGVTVVVLSVLGAIARLFGLDLAAGPFVPVAFVILVIALASTAGGFRRVARPLERLVTAARQVEAGSYDVRVPEPDRGPRELRELTRAFNTMASRLEADEERRRALLADVGHELRTPLAVIRGNLEAIADGVHPADDAHLAALVEETRVMERLVEDLRTLSLAEAGRLQLHREPTDPDVLLGEVAAGFRPDAARTGVALVVEAPDDLPIMDVDPVRVREILANLVGNAFRYTPSGGSIRLVGATAEAGRVVVFTVTDTGAGIEPELLPLVFERFAKGRDSRGSGLGLAIARDLVLAHDGTIEVRSEPGRGTSFEVRLPVEPEASTGPDAP